MLKKISVLITIIALVCTLAIPTLAEPITYDSVLYEMDLTDSSSIGDAGLGNASGIWNVGTGSEGKTCLIGTFNSTSENKLKFTVGKSEWTDYTIDMSFKIIDATGDTRATGKDIGVTVYTRSGSTLGSGNFYKYMFRNPAYYNNYFGGYAKDGTNALTIIDNNWTSGSNENAKIKTNVMQTLNTKIYNSYGTNGATVIHNVTLNGGTANEYTTTKSKWAGNGSGLINGMAGVELLSADKAATFEIYSLKITGKRTTNIIYKDNSGNDLQQIPSNGTIKVQGNFGPYVSEENTYLNPIMVTCVYDNGKLFDSAFWRIGEKDYEVVIDNELNTPADPSTCKIKTFFWSGTEDMIPITVPFVPALIQ